MTNQNSHFEISKVHTLGSKDIEIRKSEFVAKTHFLCAFQYNTPSKNLKNIIQRLLFTVYLLKFTTAFPLYLKCGEKVEKVILLNQNFSNNEKNLSHPRINIL